MLAEKGLEKKGPPQRQRVAGVEMGQRPSRENGVSHRSRSWAGKLPL